MTVLDYAAVVLFSGGTIALVACIWAFGRSGDRGVQWLSAFNGFVGVAIGIELTRKG